MAPIGDLYKKQLLSLSTRRALRRHVHGRALDRSPLRVPPAAHRAHPGLRPDGLRADGAGGGRVPGRPVRAAGRPEHAAPRLSQGPLRPEGDEAPDDLGRAPGRRRRPSPTPPRSSTVSRSRRAATSRPVSTCSCPCGLRAPSWSTAEGKGGVNTPAGRKGAEIFLELLKYAPPNVRSYTSADVTRRSRRARRPWPSSGRRARSRWRTRPARSVAGKLGYTLVPKAVRQTPMRGVWTIGIAKNSSEPGRRLGVCQVVSAARSSGSRRPSSRAPRRRFTARGSRSSRTRDQGRPAVRRDPPREPQDRQGAPTASRVRRHPGALPDHRRQAHGRASSPSTPP